MKRASFVFLRIQIRPRERDVAVPVHHLRKQGLVDVDVPGLEAVGRSGHIQAPGAVGNLVRDLDSFLPVRHQAFNPLA